MAGSTAKWRNSDQLAGYVFIGPWLIGFLVFMIVPVLSSLYFSFTKYDMLSTPQWVGLANYNRMLFDDPKYWTAWKVTLYFALVAVPVRLIFAFFVALLLAGKHKLTGVYQSVYYLPSIIGGSVAISVTWRQLFGNDGALNSILTAVGIKSSFSWLGDPHTAIWTLIVLSAWQFGSSMLIFLAGLKDIPSIYYEAATVDGANFWRKFAHITVPLISPVFLFNLIMQLINGFMVFTQTFIITKGGPLDSTLFYVLYLYQRSFQFLDVGYGSAMAWVMLIFIAAITTLIFKSSSYWVYYESKGKF